MVTATRVRFSFNSVRSDRNIIKERIQEARNELNVQHVIGQEHDEIIIRTE